MKNNNYIKLIVILFAVIMMFIVAKLLLCVADNKKTNEQADSKADLSDDEYLTYHFDENCRSDFKYSVRNKEDILYIDGTSLYRYPDNQIILENVQVKKMLYSDKYLYALDENGLFHIVDMKQLNKYQLSGVQDFEYDGLNLYFKRMDEDYIVYISEGEILNNGTVVDFYQMCEIENELNLKNYVYGDDGERYRAEFENHGPSGVTKVSVNNSNKDEKWIDIDKKYYFTNNNLSVNHNGVYLLCRKYNSTIKHSCEQNRIICDAICSLDFDAKKANKVYETESNLTRIVGFDSDNNIVYLYDVNSYRIYALDLDTNQQTTIGTLEKKYNSLVFEMSKDVLFIYTDNNELVQIVELKK